MEPKMTMINFVREILLVTMIFVGGSFSREYLILFLAGYVALLLPSLKKFRDDYKNN